MKGILKATFTAIFIFSIMAAGVELFLMAARNSDTGSGGGGGGGRSVGSPDERHDRTTPRPGTGSGDDSDPTRATPVRSDNPNFHPVAYVGRTAVLVVREDKTLWYWTLDETGHPSDDSPELPGTRRLLGMGIEAVWVNGESWGVHSYMLSSENVLWAWHTISPKDFLSDDLKDPIVLMEDVARVWQHGMDIFILKNDGTFWTINCGSVKIDLSDEIFQIEIEGVKDFITTGIQGDTVFVIKDDGTLW